MRYSAIITCTTEVEITVEAASEKEARAKIEQGSFSSAHLYDGGLDIEERFHDIDLTEESFGLDD
jgi:hypothetical protein